MIERRAGEIPTYDTRAEANETVNRAVRYKQIIDTLRGKELTAKEIAYIMYNHGLIPTPERNFTAPRLTELCKSGVVEPIGKKKCAWTGKTVAVYRLREKQETIFD